MKRQKLSFIPSPPSYGGILLIDSDIRVLTACARILESAHYRVLMATGCSQAEMLCGWYQHDLKLVVTDLSLYMAALPTQEHGYQLAGDRVFCLAHRKWPHIRLALMSAEVPPYIDSIVGRVGDWFRFLRKPIRKPSLLDLAETTLEGNRQQSCLESLRICSVTSGNNRDFALLSPRLSSLA